MRHLVSLSFGLVICCFLGCGTGGTGSKGPSGNVGGPGASPSTPRSPSGGAAGPGAITPATSKIEWLGTKANGQHTGGFEAFHGKIEPVGGDITKSKITLEIDTESLFSDNPKLTAHLKNPDFFEVKTYPKASFVSSKIEPKADGENTHVIIGNLTLHGVTKSITIPAKIQMTDTDVMIDSKFKINRFDYNINYGKGKVDDEVTITISVKAPRK